MKPSPPPGADPIRTLAVVVPVLDEAGAIDALLDHLAAFDFEEMVIADGGSGDGTRERVTMRPGVRLVECGRGRGVQLHAGALACSTDTLLFLHADTRLPEDAPALIRRALAHPGVVAGAFSARFDRPGLLLSLYSLAGRFETGLTTFGDQGMFMRRDAYLRAGGCPPWPFLEDVELRRRLKRQGRFRKLPQAVTTSARRFVAEGVLRRQLLNLAVLALFHLGVSPHRLARWYRAASAVSAARAPAPSGNPGPAAAP